MITIDLHDHADVVTNLERLHYETSARENVLALMAANGSINMASSKAYWNEYMNLFKEYQDAKDDFANNFITPNTTSNNAQWEVKFAEKVAYIYD